MLAVAHSPHRARRLQGLAPLSLSFGNNVPLASSPTLVNSLEFNQGSPSYSGFDIRSENNPFSTPVPDPSGIRTVGSSDSDTVRPNYSAFSFNTLVLETMTDLSSEVDQPSVNQRPTRGPYLFHFNQPLIDSSGPIVQQVIEPIVSPWRNNT